jgi:DNA-directed RNA polymerase II subunit RPB1
VIRIRPYGLQG